MIMEIGFPLYFLLIQQILRIQASDICFWHNQTALVVVNCDDECCSGLPTSPGTACCSSTSWSTLAVPVFVVTGVCLLALCLIYCRPFMKNCLCGCKCPFGQRARVTSSNAMSANDNPVYNVNNDDLPDYEAISKHPRTKDITPPPYNFVAAHPNDFGITETRVPSAPPQYRSRCNSTVTVEPMSPVQL